MIEAIHAGVPLVVCVTERVPLLDMVRVRQALDGTRTRLVGPNSQGVLAPKVAQLGVMSTASAAKGAIGIASRSASLTSEIVAQVTRAGLGQSTTVGIGGDPVHGLTLAECVELFVEDDDTAGHHPGRRDRRLGRGAGRRDDRPPASDQADRRAGGRTACAEAAPHGPCRRLHHASAPARPRSKIDALRAAGVQIAPNARQVGEMMRDALAGV